MNLSPVFILPVTLGGTVEEVSTQCYEFEINEFEELEGFIDIEALEPGDEGRKIVCRIEEDRCVTVTMAYLEAPIADTFLGLDLNGDSGAEEGFVEKLHAQGISAIAQFDGVVLPDHFMVIELGESITWWDEDYWGKDGFLEEAVALQ